MDERKQDELQDKPRPRPRVVDKRVSARAESGESSPAAAGDAGSGRAADDEVPSGGGTEPRRADPETETRAQDMSTDSPPLGSSPSSPSGTDSESLRAAEGDVWTPEREEQARAMAQQIAQTPSFEWVVNVAVTLANVAGTKLDSGAIADSRLAIDALAGIIDRVGSELGDAEAPLRQTLAHLQMGYAQVAGQPSAES